MKSTDNRDKLLLSRILSCEMAASLVCWAMTIPRLHIAQETMEQRTAAVTADETPLAARILDQLDAVVREAESATKPLEIEPYRGRIFEMFVTAEGAGYTSEDGEEDLTADGLCQRLSERWGLKQAAEQSFVQQENLSASQLQKMRSLWSFMRMWMEWSYAWSRWEEFHTTQPE